MAVQIEDRPSVLARVHRCIVFDDPAWERSASTRSCCPLTDAIFNRAEDLWVLARKGGHPHGDADLIIAATALEHGRVLVTGNTAHFAWVPGLRLEDWRQP